MLAAATYLAAQFRAVRITFNSLFGLDQDSLVGVLLIFSLIQLFEWTGGLIAVAYTDVMQAVFMGLAFVVLPITVASMYGTLGDLDMDIFPKPELFQTPDRVDQYLLFNSIMTSAGFFTMPHAMQRIYAARDVSALRVGFGAMVLAIVLLSFPAIITGILSVGVLVPRGVENPPSVLSALINQLVEDNKGLGVFVGVIAFTASLSGIISTSDSLIIAMSQVLTQEVVQPHMKNVTTGKLTCVARATSLLIVLGTGTLAMTGSQRCV